jgi:hypothetical protein
MSNGMIAAVCDVTCIFIAQCGRCDRIFIIIVGLFYTLVGRDSGSGICKDIFTQYGRENVPAWSIISGMAAAVYDVISILTQQCGRCDQMHRVAA